MSRRHLLTSVFTACLALLASHPASAAAAKAGFSFQDSPGDHLDVLLDGKIVAQWIYAHDRSTDARLKETFKPFLHVFDAEGKAPITQGTNGTQYPHHRGIYIGWNKISANGKSHDRWHLSGDKGATVHVKFVEQKASADEAMFTALIKWEAAKPADPPVIEEERTMSFRRGPAPARVTIDLTSKLKAPNGDVELNGDPEHAGVQYRPAGGVVTKETTYIFPKENANPADKTETDYPWVGLTYTLNGNRHSVVNMGHPENPKGTRWSAYRDYGRFGAFPVIKLKSGDTATLRHRFLIADGELPPAEFVQQQWDQFAGAKQPSPTPKLTVKGGVNKSAPKPPTPKPAAK